MVANRPRPAGRPPGISEGPAQAGVRLGEGLRRPAWDAGTQTSSGSPEGQGWTQLATTDWLIAWLPYIRKVNV
jgi:hypothetical protein